MQQSFSDVCDVVIINLGLKLAPISWSLLSFPRFFAFQPDGIMPPILAHADA